MLKDTPAPCYGCTKRHMGCHAKCPDYADWDKEHKAFLEEKRKLQETAYKLKDTEIQRRFKIKRKNTRRNKRSFGR